jgi:hypothetical protein
MELDEEESEEPARFAKQSALMSKGNPGGDNRVLTVPFLRKYLYYCKTKFSKQQLTQEAFEEISQFYVEVRQAAATGVVDPRFRRVCCASFGLEQLAKTRYPSTCKYSRACRILGMCEAMFVGSALH